jgi:threonylcarbamoyladenosine tRNA methylthiotransferase MtaB
MINTFFSYSFGCRVNHAEKELLDRKLVEAGWKMTDKNPDYFIINSCAITQKAEKEVRNYVKKIKKQTPNTKIILTGCAATLWKNKLTDLDLPVYSTFENLKKDFIFAFINKNLDTKSEDTKATDRFLASNRVVVKIQEGCSRFCSFCIVPFLRTKNKSKITNDIVEEINKDINYKEVILTAINTEFYGLGNNEDLSILIDKVMTKTKIERISFGSINPWSINPKFLKTLNKYKNNSRLLQFFHIPIQSGSDRILDLMKRDYHANEITDKINAISEIYPKALIATDIIVGFPTETDKDFQNTVELIKKLPINKVHIFRFSKRPGTATDQIIKENGEIKESIKTQRAKILKKIADEKYEDLLKKLVGYECDGLFTLNRKGKLQEILLNNQVPAWIDTDLDLSGQIRKVKICEFKNGQLFGKMTP